MTVKLLTEHHLEFLSLTGGCRGLSESKHVKMPNCWKSHVAAHMNYIFTVLPSRWRDSECIYCVAECMIFSLEMPLAERLSLSKITLDMFGGVIALFPFLPDLN